MTLLYTSCETPLASVEASREIRLAGMTPRGSLPNSLAKRADDVTQETARRAEAFVNWTRICFACAIFARSLLLEQRSVPLGLELLVLVGTAIVSLSFLRRANRGTLTRLDLSLSVLVDVTVCSCALAANVYRPYSEYRGLFRMPDASVMLALTAVTALRLSPIAVVTGVVAMLIAVRGLASLDMTLNAVRYDGGELSMVYLLLIAMGVVAYFAATHARKLVWEGALMGSKAASAQAGLELVLREHHHAKSTIAAALSASAHVERLSQAASREPRFDEGLKELSLDLEARFEQLSSVRARALSELTAQFDAEPAAVAEVIRSVLCEVGARHRQVSLRLDSAPGEAEELSSQSVWVCGGRAGLHRLLSNLVVNACEGDGRVGASQVEVNTTLSRALGVETVALCVRDDGPGVPSAWLSGEALTSTKPFGSGLGLRLVKGVVEASGGLLLVDNLARGASVTVLLRRAIP